MDTLKKLRVAGAVAALTFTLSGVAQTATVSVISPISVATQQPLPDKAVNPTSERALMMARADQLRNAGQLDQAAAVLLAVLDQQPNYAPGLNNLAIVLMQQGDYDRALLTITRALVMEEKNAPEIVEYKNTRRKILDARRDAVSKPEYVAASIDAIAGRSELVAQRESLVF